MLINLRNALMSGKRLPYDAEVEYLESTGTQWIDTGVAFSQFYTFKLCARLIPSVSERDLFGAYLMTETNKMVCGCYARFIFGYNPPGARIDSATLGTSELDVDIVYAFSSAGRTLTVNGTTYSATGAYTNGLNVTLFCANPGYNGSFKCYSFKIYDTDGTTLVRDFIPVRKGTVGYLYDRVSGKLFGNAGTGNFVLGQDVVPVEYIESHGTEYIDTGLTASDKTWIHAKLFTNETGNKNWFGASARANIGFALNSLSSTQLEFYFGNSTWRKPTVSNVVGSEFTVDFNKNGGFWVNDSLVWDLSQYTKGTDASKILIFTRAEGSAGSRISGRCKEFFHYEDNALVQKLFPVRVGTEGAMMDVLTRRIYRNAGTGAFTFGNDLKYPIPAE